MKEWLKPFGNNYSCFTALFTKRSLCDTFFFSVQQKGCFSKVVSSSGQHETKLGNVVIQAVTGDITKETSDVIVNSSNDKFTLKSGEPLVPTLPLLAAATLYCQSKLKYLFTVHN